MVRHCQALWLMSKLNAFTNPHQEKGLLYDSPKSPARKQDKRCPKRYRLAPQMRVVACPIAEETKDNDQKARLNLICIHALQGGWVKDRGV